MKTRKLKLERPFPADTSAVAKRQPAPHSGNGDALAQAIVDTVREPVLVLNKDLRVVTASRSFYQKFGMKVQDVQGRPLYALGDGQWNIPELRSLLENIAPNRAVMEAFEVEQDFAGIGRRMMLLNARTVFYEENSHTTILLGIEDVTERRAAEREIADLLRQKEILLQELQHRVANSLQIIASILLLKARTVQSEEIRQHLHDAHKRVLSIAAMQQQLDTSGHGKPIELASYLPRLCQTLAASMIGESRPIEIKVQVKAGTATSTEAVSIGLIVTELVINALKHAFVDHGAAGLVVVAYDLEQTNWRLAVTDNGIGLPKGGAKRTVPGLGTSIVEALAKQLDACVEISMTSNGTSVSITHGTMTPRLAAAAFMPGGVGVSV